MKILQFNSVIFPLNFVVEFPFFSFFSVLLTFDKLRSDVRIFQLYFLFFLYIFCCLWNFETFKFKSYFSGEGWALSAFIFCCMGGYRMKKKHIFYVFQLKFRCQECKTTTTTKQKKAHELKDLILL